MEGGASSLYSLKGLTATWMARLVIGRTGYMPRFIARQRMEGLWERGQGFDAWVDLGAARVG